MNVEVIITICGPNVSRISYSIMIFCHGYVIVNHDIQSILIKYNIFTVDSIVETRKKFLQTYVQQQVYVECK